MKKVLMVDDELAYVEVVKDHLQTKCEFISAGNGKDGLALALREKPDLILLDISMPVMDGQTMLTELRKDEWGKRAKVIFLTNLEPNVNIVQQAASEDPTFYVVKSTVSLKDLMQMVEGQLKEE
jgi:CheY-like chemotaxis protein